MSTSESPHERQIETQKITNEQATNIVADLILASASNDLESRYNDVLAVLGDNQYNYLTMIDVMGGVLSGMLAKIARDNEMNFETVVRSIFNDQYAQLLDLYEALEDGATSVPNSAESIEGTNPTDGIVGDGKVDGMEQGG